ncbi:MAG TPA: hypothetical protein VKC60_10855, partial [Opitutaceae bacterium]|nr:hypothetical protein [Opitutaceae bacterium]
MLLLFWAAFGVFSQLAFVRLFSTTAGETGYYGNIFFIVSIFSLSCGLLCKRLAKYSFLIPALILVSYFAALWLGNYNLLQQLPGEFQWSAFANVHPKEIDFDLQLAVLILCTTTVPVMLLIGAKQMEAFIALAQSANGYILMGVGGVMGAAVFTLQNRFFPSHLSLAIIWMAACLVPIVRRFREDRKAIYLFLSAGPIPLFVFVAWVFSQGFYWSPYQRVSVQFNEGDNSVYMYTNGFFISNIHLHTTEALHRDPDWLLQAAPFEWVQGNDNVLILGSGGGTTDVREALHRGAHHVTAVEIDSQFISLGIQYDPEKAYLDPRVIRHVADARRFLSVTNERFDFIYMPFVDSQANASNQSRFRLDSFLYTKEGLASAYSKVKEGGVFFLSFATATPWIRHRMFNLLQEATGADVHAYSLSDSAQTTYVVSRGRLVESFPKPFFDATRYFKTQPKQLVPTDDWPFFYSRTNSIPPEHLRLLYILLIGMVAIFAATRALTMNRDDKLSRVLDPGLRGYAFFSGAAFFFIQIRTISTLTPYFGASYISQAVVVMAVIVCSLLGAWIGTKIKVHAKMGIWTALFLAVALGFQSHLVHPMFGTVFPSIFLFVGILLLPVAIAGYLYMSYIEALPADDVLDLQMWNLAGGAIGSLAEGVVVFSGFH